MTLSATQTHAKTRVALWDNARFALIVLVVIGHVISTVRTDTALAFGIYAYIYLFHMPAMILLSGVFAKPEVNPKAIKSTVQLLVVWLTWEGIWAVIRAVWGDKLPGNGFLVSPAWTLWFLVSLATMRVLLPYIARLRHPLLFSIGLAVIGPLLPAIGVNFSAARTLAFLPFFVGGWIIKERGWLARDWFLTPSARGRVSAWGVLAAVGALFAVIPLVAGTSDFKTFWRIDKWLTHRDSYAWMFKNAPIGEWGPTATSFGGWIGLALGGVLICLMLIAIASALTLALLVVVPRGHSVFTVWGARTLYVYLLHGVVVWFGRETGVIDAVGSLGSFGVALLVLIGFALAALLSMAWVTKVFRPIVEPRFDWMFSRESTPAK